MTREEIDVLKKETFKLKVKLEEFKKENKKHERKWMFGLILLTLISCIFLNQEEHEFELSQIIRYVILGFCYSFAVLVIFGIISEIFFPSFFHPFDKNIKALQSEYWQKEKQLKKAESDYKTHQEHQLNIEGSKPFNSQLENVIDELDELSHHFYNKRLNERNIQQWNEYCTLLNKWDEKVRAKANDWKHHFNSLDSIFYKHLNYMISRERQSDNSRVSNLKTSINKKSISKKRELSNEEKVAITLDKFIEKMLRTKKPSENFQTVKTQIGELGEKIVMEREAQKLIQLGIESTDYPIHVSKLHGDQFGFDILSVDENLKPLLLEVKATSKNSNHHFYFTRNEMKKMEHYKDQYRIIRVSNVNQENIAPSMDQISFTDLNENYSLETEVFKVVAK